MRPLRRREAGCEAGWINWPVRSIKRGLRRRKCSPSLAVKESLARVNRAKARNAPGSVERVRRDLSAYGAWNGQMVVLGTGEALLGPVPAGGGSSIGL